MVGSRSSGFVDAGDLGDGLDGKDDDAAALRVRLLLLSSSSSPPPHPPPPPASLADSYTAAEIASWVVVSGGVAVSGDGDVAVEVGGFDQ